MKIVCLCLLILVAQPLCSQNAFRGNVVDESGNPVAGASVFLANTTFGTTSDAKGIFVLSVPSGKYELIISSIGFETYTGSLNTASIEPNLIFRLKPRVQELETVVVEPFVKDGWVQWGTFFMENFIGMSPFARDCKILNYKTIRFRYSKQKNELTAYAFEPLLIENKALGYNIRFQMESFSYNFKTHYLLFEGYPLFELMTGSVRKQRKWEENRLDAYEGSEMHFMRALYRNKLAEEGFEVRRLVKVVNQEKLRVKEANLAAQRREIKNGVMYVQSTLTKDTQDYYSKILRQSDFFDVLSNSILKGDSIAYAIDSVTAGLDFKNYLYILYKNKIAPDEYWRNFSDRGQAMISQITLVNNEPIEIQANGHYIKPLDLINLGYWSWSEKLGNMLPYDYVPQKKKQ